MGKKCNSCEKTSFPVFALCPFCSSENGEKVTLSKIGTLFSYSITRVPVGPYPPPIIAGYVDLPEGTRIFSQIHVNVDEIQIGMKLILKTGAVWTEKDGTEVMGYYYVPYNAQGGGEK